MAKSKINLDDKRSRYSILSSMSTEMVHLKTMLKDGLIIQAYERILQIQEYLHDQQQIED